MVRHPPDHSPFSSEWRRFVIRVVPFWLKLGLGWWLWFGDGFRFAYVLLAVGGGPDVSAVAVFQGPSAFVFEPVVVSAAGEDAVVVAGADEVGEGGGGPVGGAAVVEQVPGHRVGEQSPPGAVGGEFPCHLGGDGSVPGQFRAVFGQAREHGGGHGDLHQHPVAPAAAGAAGAPAAAGGAAGAT